MDFMDIDRSDRKPRDANRNGQGSKSVLRNTLPKRQIIDLRLFLLARPASDWLDTIRLDDRPA